MGRILSSMLLLVLLTACAAQPPQTTEIPRHQEQPPSGGPASASPASIYQDYSGSVYYVKTECAYSYIYPDFFIRSSVNGVYGIYIDLTMRKNTTAQYAAANGTVADDASPNSEWLTLARTNATRQYGTAFAVEKKTLYTNNHVVECPTTASEIIDSFDLNDLSGQDLNKIAKEMYDNQANFQETRTSQDLISLYVNNTVAEHFRSKANFTLVNRKIALYHENSGYTKPTLATVTRNETSFPGVDYAVLSAPSIEDGVPIAKKDVVIGDPVYIIGFPFVVNFEHPEYHGEAETNPPVVTQGIISNRLLSDDNVTYYAVDAAATFGSSGSPVFDSNGEVIGIETAGYGGINLLLPITDVRR